MESNIGEVSIDYNSIQITDGKRSKMVHSNRLQHRIQAMAGSSESAVTERISPLWTPQVEHFTDYKYNLIMATATDLISSLPNITLSRDVPFYQPQQLQCLHQGSTETYLCSPLYSIPFSFIG